MGIIQGTSKKLIAGRDRGRYIDFLPYHRSGYLWPGELSDRTYSVNNNASHICDVNAYGNVYDTGHFYARYRVWGCKQAKSDHSFAPRLSWKFIVNLLKSSPDPITFQWEMRKHIKLLMQTVHCAGISEIASLIKCHERHEERILSQNLSGLIQERINSFHSEAISSNVRFLAIIRRYGFHIPLGNEHIEANALNTSLVRIRKMLAHRRNVTKRLPH